MADAEGGERIRTEDVVSKDTLSCDFKQLFLSEPVVRGLKDSNYLRPTPIQMKAIPLGCIGSDLVVQSKAGTGKTLIFAVIALERLDVKSALPQAVMLSATREIALQITSVVNQVGRHMDGLQCHAFIGGTARRDDRARLKSCQVVVGSTGRVKDLLCDSAMMHSGSVGLLVLDEVDALLSGKETLGDVNAIFRELPAKKQVCTFSATYSDSLKEVLQRYMSDPQVVSVKDTDATVSLRGVTEYYHVVPATESRGRVMSAKMNVLTDLLQSIPFTQCIVFCNDHDAAEAAAKFLCGVGLAADAISAKLEQKERSAVIAAFASFNVRVLLSSDLTSRGIDMTKVNLVVNLDVPQMAETYMHRIGRTGRYGSVGIAVSLVVPAELQRLRNMRGEMSSDRPLLVLPADKTTISGDHMKGVLQSEEEVSIFKQHEQNRAGAVQQKFKRRKRKDQQADGEPPQSDAKRPATAPERSRDASPQPKRARVASAKQEQAAAAPDAAVCAPASHTPAAAAAAPAPAPAGGGDWGAVYAALDRYNRAYYSVAFECVSQCLGVGAGLHAHVPAPPPMLVS